MNDVVGCVMSVNEYLPMLTEWYQQTISGSTVWSAVGFGVVALTLLLISAAILRGIFVLLRNLFRWIARKRRKSWQGYGIGLSTLTGGGGAKVTKAFRETLNEELNQFLFGAPFSLVRADKPKAKGQLGIRDFAAKWLRKNDADTMIWGHRPGHKKSPIQLDILSREGGLPAEEAVHTRVFLPRNYAKAPELVRRIGAYLVARALQPGLAAATAFKAEKIEEAAATLANALALENAFPDETRSLIEGDYCAMGLHIGSHDHLTRIVALRRKRLSALESLSRQDQASVRIDLGRALLALSELKFDPAQLREAMDHLKIAVEQLREHPTIKVATATSQAVQKGQSMLSARQRFSVTGGAGV